MSHGSNLYPDRANLLPGPAVLVASVGLPCHSIHPGVDLQRRGFFLPNQERCGWRSCGWVSVPGAAFAGQPWLRPLPGVFPSCSFRLPYCSTTGYGFVDRTWPVAIHDKSAVCRYLQCAAQDRRGELVLYLTSLKNHKHSGYCCRCNGIALKVRFIIAEQLGRRMDDVQRRPGLPISVWTEYSDAE